MVHPRLALAIRRPTLRGLRRLAPWLLVLLIAVYVGYVVLGPNAHSVIDGRVYRTAQLGGDSLKEYIRKHDIKTVINLRGFCPDFDWYQDEVNATAALGVSQEDITLSANRLPPPTELKRLIEVFDHTTYPVVLHCKQGADRTGLASAMVLLLYTDASLDRGRRELLPHRGHWPVARTAAMDEFFDRYESWLDSRSHASALFRDWVLNHYVPGPAKAELTWITPVPESIPAGKPFALTLRATNRSGDDWRFTAGSTSGIHLQYAVYDATWTELVKDQAGFLNRIVKPGESIDLVLAFPKLPPGTHSLRVEMADYSGAAVPVRAKYFYQFGDPVLLGPLVVK